MCVDMLGSACDACHGRNHFALRAGALGIEAKSAERGAEIELHGGVVRGEGISEVGEGLAVVLDALAGQIQGDDASLAPGLGLDGAEDGSLLDAGA